MIYKSGEVFLNIKFIYIIFKIEICGYGIIQIRAL